MDIPPPAVARVRELYARGLYVQALAAGEPFGPVREWAGPSARLLAGRLAIQLGATRLGRRLHLAAFRSSPAYPEAIYYHARYRLERFGPLSAWRFMRDHPDWSDAPPELRADWLSLGAFVAARVRDFDRADKLLAQADAMAPDRPWVDVERAAVLEAADRSDDAMASARRALAKQPWFRPGVQAVAHLLQRRGQDVEAVEFLTEAVGHLESGIVAAQLAAIQIDLGRWADARTTLDLYEKTTPLREIEGDKWLAARRADVAYRLGEHTAAAGFARTVGEEFYTKFADRLDDNDETTKPARHNGWALPLDLSYDAAPPTPTDLLARFWNVPVPPAADATPAPDGLPDAAERRRFAAAGWIAHEFALTSDAAVSLIARGVPFFITLVEAGFSQTRLVVGADPVRRGLLLADGTDRRPAEAPTDVLTERYAPFGPRCLVAVPPAHAAKLDDLPLPDADAYDWLFAVQTELADRRFAAAKEKLTALAADRPGHRIAKLAAVAWARATGHPVLLLDAATDLLADFPHDPTLVLTRASALRDLGRVPERLALLQAEAAAADADPLLQQSLAQMLLTDPQHHREAERLLRRSVRVRPQAAAGYFLLATRWWEDGRFAEAAEWYRMAACLDEREEQFAETYAKAARVLGQVPEALRLFQRRATGAAVPSPPAARALFQTLLDRDEPDQAFAALGRAIEKLQGQPGPPAALAELLLFRAEQHANFGRAADADADLAAAKPLAPPAAWLKAAARVARTKPAYTAALGHVRALLDLDPLNAEAHRIAAGLVADTEGRAAARTHLDQVVERFPGVYPLAKLRAEFVFRDPDDSAIDATRTLLAVCPHDAWAHRQLALVLADRRRPDEALAAVTAAGEIEPDHPSHFAVLGHVHRRADRTDAALAAFRAGVQAMPDHELCITELVESSRGAKEKKNAVRFVAGVLWDRPHTGEGLTAYAGQAARLVEDAEDQEWLLVELERFLDRRPDLWQCWSLVVQQLVAMHRADEAYSLAQDATARFPLSARLWMDLAEAARYADRPEDRIDALRQAASAAPGWPPVAKELADALAEEDGDDAAVAVLERSAAANPLDPVAHWLLADRLWDAGRSDEALERAKQSVRLEPAGQPEQDPRPDLAWGAVMAWSDQVMRNADFGMRNQNPSDIPHSAFRIPHSAEEFARKLAADRAGDPRAWLRLARCLHDPAHSAEALAALDKAIRLDPRNVEAHDLRAEKLASVGRFEEALEAARPDALAADVPLVLQGRAAWVEARRGNYAAAIPPMQALVAVDPEYVWGWQQLAEWYNETGRPESYLEAASELTRLRPESPVPLAMRGEAKVQTGDRAGGKEDLKEVLRSYPGYSPAAAVLFDACLADGELRDARSALAVLQEYLVGPEVVVKQLQYATKAGDEDGAARAFAEIARHPGEGTPLFLQMGLAEMRMADLGDRAADVMYDAWKSGEPFNPWSSIYWLDTADGEAADAADKLAACDAAVRHYPGFVPGHDRRAEQLAAAGRYDDALAACAPPGVGPPVPVALRGRAAWVEAQRGDRDGAIDRMNAVLADEPDYTWGWRQLTHWYDATGRPRDCLHAADQLVRLNPDDALAHGIRGEARRAVGDHRGAKDDFARAFELDPSFDAAGLQLVAAQLATDDVPGAARTVKALRDHADNPLVRLRAVQVAARQGDLAAAREEFRALGRDADAPRGALREAATALAEAGWAAEADADLDELATDPGANPAAAAVWAERTVSSGQPQEVADRLSDVAEASRPAGREAVATYARLMAEGGRGDLVAATVQRHADLLREDDLGWARAGAALAEAKQWGLAAAWMGDWKVRSDLPPGALRPLADALLALERDAEAEELMRAAVEASPDEVPVEFRAWLAVFGAVAGRTDDAVGHLTAVDRIGQPDWVKLLLVMASTLVAVQQAGAKGAAFAEGRENLKAAAGACEPADVPPGATRWWRAVADQLAADAGTIAARLWALRQRVGPWVKGA